MDERAQREMAENRAHWDEITPIHVASRFYDVDGFRAGRSTLSRIDREELLPEVRGKTLLHLQCHFGMDTISWAREGAIVTGIDFSEPAVQQARALARDCDIDARFVLSNVYELPRNLEGQFDIVYTSYGAITWLPDLGRWAQVIARFLRRGGVFFMVEFHPMMQVLDDAPGTDDLVLRYPYFRDGGGLRFDDGIDYADPTATLAHKVTYNYPYPLGDVVTALIDAGLRIEYLHEFPFSEYQFLPFTAVQPDGTVRLTQRDGNIPLLFSIRATKSA